MRGLLWMLAVVAIAGVLSATEPSRSSQPGRWEMITAIRRAEVGWIMTPRAGLHRVSWNSGHAPSGVYFCRMAAGKYRAALKLVKIE